MKVFSGLQLPFEVCRSLSICLTSPEEYNRGQLFASCLLSPVWVAFYMYWEHETLVGASGSFWAFVGITTLFR